MNRFIALLVFSQFACTSVWFAANAVLPTLIASGLLPENALPHLTGAVQLGFILGTFTFALFNVADRFSPRYVFLSAALVAAGSTAALLLPPIQYGGMLGLRLLTGFALAGIYPVGMKIAADHHPEGLGKALGFLVGALVLGTAFPHFSQAFLGQTDWRLVILSTSLLALVGGITLGLGTQDGPHRKAGQKIAPWAFLHVFRVPKFRSAAIGYFGHMWELYTFWAFVPFLLSAYSLQHQLTTLPLSLLAFSCIAIGMAGCILFGLISLKKGPAAPAAWALSLSLLCCLSSPFFFLQGNSWLFIAFLHCWGFFVIADSPLFSTLVAGTAPAAQKATALTIVNCLGFALTIGSIQVMEFLISRIGMPYAFTWLSIGPLLGLAVFLRGQFPFLWPGAKKHD